MSIKPSELAKTSILLISATLLVACTGTSPKHPNQPALPVGSKIQLNITADLPVGENSIYIQNQTLVSSAQIDKYQVFCSVLMNEYQQANEPQQKVEPGEFKVSRVRLYNDYVHQPVIYANNDSPFWAPSFFIHFRTEIYLESASQPQVVALICTRQSVEYKKIGYYPQRPQFEAQLGDFVELP